MDKDTRAGGKMVREMEKVVFIVLKGII